MPKLLNGMNGENIPHIRQQSPDSSTCRQLTIVAALIDIAAAWTLCLLPTSRTGVTVGIRTCCTMRCGVEWKVEGRSEPLWGPTGSTNVVPGTTRQPTPLLPGWRFGAAPCPTGSTPRGPAYDMAAQATPSGRMWVFLCLERAAQCVCAKMWVAVESCIWIGNQRVVCVDV